MNQGNLTLHLQHSTFAPITLISSTALLKFPSEGAASRWERLLTKANRIGFEVATWGP